jgi:hypothetical protein
MRLIKKPFVSVFKYWNPSSIERLILIRFCYLMLIVYSFTSCSEILSVPDISHERVEILSPSDEATVQELPVMFQTCWNFNNQPLTV